MYRLGQAKLQNKSSSHWSSTRADEILLAFATDVFLINRRSNERLLLVCGRRPRDSNAIPSLLAPKRSLIAFLSVVFQTDRDKIHKTVGVCTRRCTSLYLELVCVGRKSGPARVPLLAVALFIRFLISFNGE